MTKVKNYALLAFSLFILLLALQNYIQKGRIEKRDADIERLKSNVFQLMAEKRTETTLYLKQKEVSGKLSKERDSLAKALKIRPKEIQKIVYIDNTIIDTVKIPVPVQLKQDFWTLSDKSKCILWEAEVYLEDRDLKVWRTNLEYSNRITETFYRKRPSKFLFFRYGKYVNYQQVDAECGGVQIKEFNFVK
jgi:hypothetical protein